MFLSFAVNGVGGNARLPPAPLTLGRVRGEGRGLMPSDPNLFLTITRKPGRSMLILAGRA
jgi:hypothetical protein